MEGNKVIIKRKETYISTYIPKLHTLCPGYRSGRWTPRQLSSVVPLESENNQNTQLG